VITIDGGTGRVILGPVDLVPPQINEDFETILGWADDVRRLKVRANATRPRTRPRHASSARRASASAAPSTCSWPRTGSRSCAR
jgi:phosphoenolpyruvate synthase/pyruvate phosphate dikinase